MSREGDRRGDLERIAAALAAAGEVLADFTAGAIDAEIKAGGSPVTEADRRLDEVLKRILPRGDEGWLSEETVDDPARLGKGRVWIVDPLDGTKEFVEGLPEWCVSIGLVEGERPVAGGILNPAAGHTILGSLETGVTLNGEPAEASRRDRLDGAVVLASRSEVRRGQWEAFEGLGFEVRAMGSVAYKMGCVAAGLVDATWTLVPKNEWDIAAGVALVDAAGGETYRPDGAPCRFNQPRTLYPGFVACGPRLRAPIDRVIAGVDRGVADVQTGAAP